MNKRYEIIGSIPGKCPACGKYDKELVVFNPKKGKGSARCERCFNTWVAQQM